MTSKFSRRPRIQPTPPVCKARPGYIPAGGEPVGAAIAAPRLIYPSSRPPVGSGGPAGCKPPLPLPLRVYLAIKATHNWAPPTGTVTASALIEAPMVDPIGTYQATYTQDEDFWSIVITTLPGDGRLHLSANWLHTGKPGNMLRGQTDVLDLTAPWIAPITTWHTVSPPGSAEATIAP